MPRTMRALMQPDPRSRGRRTFCLGVLGGGLAGCVLPILPSPSQLMWALLKPLVGLDPNVVNLYEQPLIKNRMTALLGPHYDTTLTLLRTADQLQQEGPLFFVVSRFTPIPDLAKRAGLVWNSDTNRMAAALMRGDGVQVFTEALGDAIEERATAAAETAVQGAVQDVVWPTVMQAWVRP
jgi:hypothetical protein